MVLTKYVVGKNLWGDKTLDAAKFCDDIPPHVHPVAGDLDINTIIDGIQSNTIGHPHDGTYGILVKTLGTPVTLGSQTTFALNSGTNPVLIFDASGSSLGGVAQVQFQNGPLGVQIQPGLPGEI